MFRRSKKSLWYGNATRTIANDPDDWDDLDPLDRVELYPDDPSVNFEAIIWKRSQTTETIGTIEGYPLEIITIIPVIENKFGLDATEVEKNDTKMFASHMGTI